MAGEYVGQPGGCYGVFPYQEFHEANLDPEVGVMVEKKKPAERRRN
jgi:hypothetical protein